MNHQNCLLITAMDNLKQGVVDVHNTPVTKRKDDKLVLQYTPIPKVVSPKWKEGIPTLVQEGVISPNQQAIQLMTGFVIGHIRMVGDQIEHLTTIP